MTMLNGTINTWDYGKIDGASDTFKDNLLRVYITYNQSFFLLANNRSGTRQRSKETTIKFFFSGGNRVAPWRKRMTTKDRTRPDYAEPCRTWPE